MRTRRAVASGVVWAAFWVFAAPSDAKPPQPPAATVPDIKLVNPTIFCVDFDRSFDISTHRNLLEGLASNPYNGELRKALYTQDPYHQFQSKAHFDNCDFDDATAYVSEMLEDAGRFVDVATKAKAAQDSAAMKKAVLSAFFSLGQALHGTQDFYAHTNYVELQVPKVDKVTDIELIFPWRPEGRARIKELRASGLVSGAVSWGFPKDCPDGTPSHASLNKDSANTKSGKVFVARLQNLSRYRIAVYLARESSLQLLNDAFKKWPLLKEVNGAGVAVDVIVDRRGADKP